jgi:GATA-binding protein
MSSADYEERGGTAASRITSAVNSPTYHSHFPGAQPSSSLDDTDSSTWSSVAGPLTANTSSTNLSPANFSSTAISHHHTSSQHTKPTSPNLDLSASDSLARNELLLRDTVFPDWRDDAQIVDLDSPGEMQKKDPLGTQIWKLYSRTKSRLPNQERMENLTWRMMAMNLRRREQQQAAYENLIYPGTSNDFRLAGTDLLLFSAKEQSEMEAQAQLQPSPQSQIKSPPTQTSNAPSGIAQQLRGSIDHSLDLESASDPMNLDDFIVPSSVASPAGITSPAGSEMMGQFNLSHGLGIPITSRSRPQLQIPQNMPPASLPQSSIAQHRTSEFDYVQKRVRKTSIDERRGVSVDSYHPAEIFRANKDFQES